MNRPQQRSFVTGLLSSGVRRLSPWLTSASIAGPTEAARSSERNRRAMVSSIAALALRGSSFVVVLISVPLTLAILGPVRFGMWMTISSVVALLSVTDLGIGNGVLNSIARAYAKGDTTAARSFLTSGLVALSGIALVLGIIFLASYSTIPWAAVYNVIGDPLASSEAGPASAVFIVTFLIGLPLGLAGQVRGAHQEGFTQSAFAGLGNLFTLGLLLIAVHARASLPLLVLAMTSGPIMAAIINWAVLIGVQRPWLAPHLSDLSTESFRSVIGVGLAFLILQVAYTVGFSIDRLVVAHYVGPAAVADYSVVYRLFAIPGGLAAIALVPLWPAYSEAMARRDTMWVRRTLARSLRATIILTVPVVLGLLIFGPAIVFEWTGHTLSPPFALYLAMGGFIIAFAIASGYAMFLNGAQLMRYQISTMTIMALINIVISVILASRIGVSGVALGSLISVTAALILPALVYVPRALHALEQPRSTSPEVTSECE